MTSDVARRTPSNAVTAAVRATIGADVPSAARRVPGLRSVGGRGGPGHGARRRRPRRGCRCLPRDESGRCTAGGPVLVGPVASSGGWSTADRCRSARAGPRVRRCGLCRHVAEPGRRGPGHVRRRGPGAEIRRDARQHRRRRVDRSGRPAARRRRRDRVRRARRPTTSAGGGPAAGPGRRSVPAVRLAPLVALHGGRDDPPTGRGSANPGHRLGGPIARRCERPALERLRPTRPLTAARAPRRGRRRRATGSPAVGRAPAPPSSRATGTSTDDSADRPTGTAGSPAAWS